MWRSFWEDHGPPIFQSLNLSELGLDEAFLRIQSDTAKNVSVYHKSSLCYMCPYRRILNLTSGQNDTLKYDTTAHWSFFIGSGESGHEFINSPDHSDGKICSLYDMSMGEFGIYEINVENSSCEYNVLKNPVFIYGAIILAVLFYLILGISWKLLSLIFNSIRRRIKARNQNIDPFNGGFSNSLAASCSPSLVKKSRLQSLDTFRGITITLMIFVNHGGGGYWFFSHAPWNGLRLADVIFPWFLWIMGVCIPFGMKSQIKNEVSKSKAFLRILERSLKLFVIGIILNTVGGQNQLESLRIPGVLQRFAVSYFVTSCIYLFCGPMFGATNFKGYARKIEDIIELFPQLVLYTIMTIGYAVFIFYMPIPGCPTGYVGPGGIVLMQNGTPSPDCIGGITRMVDIWILGNNHIFQYPTASHIYETSSFDPEGILGSVPTILQVFLGIQAGQILLSFNSHKSRVYRWLSWSMVTLVGSLLLSSGIIIGGPIPVNKNLWSLSYVFITSSSAFLLLTFCYYLIDYKNLWTGSPFCQTGMNSIFLYVGHFFAYNVFPWRYKYGNMETHMARLPEALFGTTLWVLIALYLHKKKKFYVI